MAHTPTLPPGAYVRECRRCRGKGSWQSNRLWPAKQCPTCLGSGYVWAGEDGDAIWPYEGDDPPEAA